MQSIIKVETPATNIDLITLEEFKLGLKITGTTNDQFLMSLITNSSDAIAHLCNRVFAKERVTETFYEISGDSLYLSHWPVVSDGIESVTANEVALEEDVDYTLQPLSGRLLNISDTVWDEPVVVVYSGGYVLPDQSPPALRQAVTLLGRENYNAAQRGDSTVRMISHKDSRVIYFDPNAAANKGVSASSGGTAAQRAINDLLTRFMRFEV